MEAHSDTTENEAGLPHHLLSSIRVLDQIGRGSFGSVHKCFFNGHTRALKKLNLANTSVRAGWIRERLVNEIELLHKVGSESEAFVRIYSVCTENGGGVIGYVMEYFKFGNLRSVFNKMKSYRLDCQNFPWLAAYLLHQISVGLRYLQEGRQEILMHRDVAIDNIFVNGNMQAKLGDFGLSRRLNELLGQDTLHFESLVGIERRPPELLLDPLRPPSIYIDRYLFGICLFEALTCSSLRHRIGDNVASFRDLLIEGRHADYLVDAIRRDCFDAYPQRLRQPTSEFQRMCTVLTDAMQRCLASDPEERPAFSWLCDQIQEVGNINCDGVRRELELARTLLQSDALDNSEATFASGWAATNGEGFDSSIRTTNTSLSSMLQPGDFSVASTMPLEYSHQFSTNLRVGEVQGAIISVGTPSQEGAGAHRQTLQQRRFTSKLAPNQLLAAIFQSSPLRDAWPELLRALGAPEQAVAEAALAARTAGRRDADAAIESLRLLPAPPTVRQLAEGLAAARCSDSTLRLLGRLQEKYCSPLSSSESTAVR